MENNQLTQLQQEIQKAFEQLGEKAVFSEAILAKKIRENTKISGKQKAGIGMNDLEKVIMYLDENNSATYSLHLNSANDLLIKKDDVAKCLEGDARKRRQSSEKSMDILTVRDLSVKKTPDKNKKRKRTERKNININSDFESFDDE